MVNQFKLRNSRFDTILKILENGPQEENNFIYVLSYNFGCSIRTIKEYLKVLEINGRIILEEKHYRLV